MKRKLILLLLVIVSTVTIQAQKPFVVFGHVQKDLFTSETVDRTIKATGTFLWSLDAIIGGFELNWNKEIKNLDGTLMTAAGMVAGYKHFKPDVDGPVSDWGVHLGIMTKVKINETMQAKIKIPLLVSYYNFMGGPVFTPSETNGKKIGLLIMASIQF